MTQPIHPHHVSQLLEPALTEIVHAISDRGGLTTAEYDAKAEDTWTLIESFQPRDAIDLMLTGQLVAFNAVFADATRDVLRGMEDSIKQRTQSGLIAMVRLTQGHVDRLAKRGNQPYQTEVAAPRPAQRPTVAPIAAEPPQPVAVAAEPPAVPETTPRQADAATPAAPEPMRHQTDSATAPEPSQAVPPAEEQSWLDEPYQQWLIETPADIAARAEAARTTAVHALQEASQWGRRSSVPTEISMAERAMAERATA